MPRRNTNRNRYSRRNVPKLSLKEQQALEQQAELERYQKTSQYIEDRSIEFFNYQLVVKGSCIKGTVKDIMLLNMGYNHNMVHIKDQDIEVKCDQILLCYSHKVQKYIWLGFDYTINTAYILFYSNSLADMINEHDIDMINMNIIDHFWETDSLLIEDINKELKNVTSFFNMQEAGQEIINKDQLFDLIEDIEVNKEGETIRKKHILEI